MKIAIITLPLNNNFGGILQAYALREYLLQKGHKVVHVEEKNKHSVVHWPSYKFNAWWYLRRVIRQIFTFNLDKKRNYEDVNRYKFRKSTAKIRRFVKENLEVLTVDDFSQLKKYRFDAIIVGSDQIWRVDYYSKIENTFLSFAEFWKLKKITYAPSFGTDEWQYNDMQTEYCSKLLKQFDGVSVREDEGVKLCLEKLSVVAQRLLDPTMLLDRNVYEALISDAVNGEPKQLTSYILDMTESKEKVIRTLVNKKEFNHVPLGLTKIDNEGQFSDYGLEKWLKEFIKAEFIFTDSFHGCVFAILFHKPFIAYGNKDRGISRFNTLLRLFELEHRMIQSGEGVEYLLQDKIEWEKIDVILNEERKKASNFFIRLGIE